MSSFICFGRILTFYIYDYVVVALCTLSSFPNRHKFINVYQRIHIKNQLRPTETHTNALIQTHTTYANYTLQKQTKNIYTIYGRRSCINRNRKLGSTDVGSWFWMCWQGERVRRLSARIAYIITNTYPLPVGSRECPGTRTSFKSFRFDVKYMNAKMYAPTGG